MPRYHERRIRLRTDAVPVGSIESVADAGIQAAAHEPPHARRHGGLMSLLSLTLVVLAAFIHATWNPLSKRAADAGPTFVFAYNLFACLVYLPWMIWLLVYGELHWNLPVAACLVLSAAIHLAYSLCLQRGYQVADL